MQKLSKFWAAVLCVTLMLACVVPAGATGQAQSTSKGADIMLLVDDTGSMRTNDPNHIASVAMQTFVELLPDRDIRVGMATYDDHIITSTGGGMGQAMINVESSADKDPLRNFAQNGLTQRGAYTDLPGALYYAVQQLQNFPALDNQQVIIVVSDGEDDYPNAAARQDGEIARQKALAAGIPVYLIVIRDQDDYNVTKYMEGIAEDTNGEVNFIESGDDIDTFLKHVIKDVLGLVVDEDHKFNGTVNPEPKDWEFPLQKGVFEATVELTHEQDLHMQMFGPDGEIMLEGNQSVLMSSIQNRSGLKTFIRLIEPDEGEYILRLSSEDSQAVLGEIILNNEIYVQVDFSTNPGEPGDTVEVKASLMRGTEPYTDLEFANLTASISIDGNWDDMERDDDEGVFRYSLTVPAQEGDLEVIVDVDGQKSFHRSSDAATLTIKGSNGNDDNDTISVKVEFSANSAKPGEDVEVKASLTRGKKPYTDLAIAGLTATISIDGDQTEMEPDEKEGVFRYSLTAPDETGDLKVKVTVTGQGGFRESGSATLTIRVDPPWFMILAAVLLIVIILIALVLLLIRIRIIDPVGSKYIQLSVSLTVQYFDDMHKHIWEKYVTMGSLYTKRSPHESLGGLLRMQNQDYGDIPEYFDKILLTGMRYGNNQLCIEVRCDIDTPSGPVRMNQRIDIPNGMGMDDMGGISFSGGMSSASLVFPDKRQLEIKLQ